MNIFTTFITDPIFNALVALYGLVGDMGIAIIIITVIVRAVLLPLSNKALRSQRRLQALQPELKKLQDKHKEDREALAKEMMAFYKKEGVSPASSCVPTLVQIPILIALYFVFREAVSGQHLGALYSFVPNPGHIDPKFLGLLDLSQRPNSGLALILPLVTGLSTFVQSRMLLPTGDGVPAMNKQLVYLFPLLTFFFATSLPAALPLYWTASTVFTIIQQYVIIRELPLAEAKAEGVADWNAANPEEPVPGTAKLSAKKSAKGSNVTVRKRGE